MTISGGNIANTQTSKLLLSLKTLMPVYWGIQNPNYFLLKQRTPSSLQKPVSVIRNVSPRIFVPKRVERAVSIPSFFIPHTYTLHAAPWPDFHRIRLLHLHTRTSATILFPIRTPMRERNAAASFHLFTEPALNAMRANAGGCIYASAMRVIWSRWNYIAAGAGERCWGCNELERSWVSYICGFLHQLIW